jgi:protein phosphatase
VIPSERSHLYAAAITHPGMSGKHNEDRYAVSAYRLEDENSTPAVFAILADGVGGHLAGEVAAEIAVDTISSAVAASDGSTPQETLEYAIVQAGELINRQASRDDEQRGMGSTCACAWVIGDRLYTASVGDSRIYLLQEENIRQLTVDHTWVQEALDHGIITPDQAQNHPRSHIIRRYLGSKSAVVPDLRLKLSPDESDAEAVANQGMRLFPGDKLVLCSDGLSDLVSDAEILAAFQENPLPAALASLVELANKNGGHDNITILALKFPNSGETPQGVVVEQKMQNPAIPPSLLPWAIGGAALLGVLLLLVLVVLFLR